MYIQICKSYLGWLLCPAILSASTLVSVCGTESVCLCKLHILYMLFLKADIKGALIQSDSGINTIPNLIDPTAKSFNYTPLLRSAPCTEGEAQGNNLSPSLQNEKAATE